MTRITTKIVSLVIALSAVTGLTQAQVYQLPNSNFEEWENGVKLDGTEFTAREEPVGWNSFGTGTGNAIAVANMFVKNFPFQRNRGTEEAPNYYTSVYAGGFGSIVANGNMTTGIIRAQDPSAGSEENYNFTPVDYSADDYPGVDNFRQRFDGKPDALKVSLQYLPKTQTENDIALVTAWIHTGEANFQNPYENEETLPEKAVAYAEVTPNATEAKEWKEFIVPFDYEVGNEGNEPAYMLFSVTTNKTPGSGSVGDTINIDDIEMIYYYTLTDIKIDGVTIEGFDENTFDYLIRGYGPQVDDITYTSKGKGAIVEMDETSGFGSRMVKLYVQANDYEVSGNYSSYYLSCLDYDPRLKSIKLDGVALEGFIPNTRDYEIEIGNNPIPAIEAEGINEFVDVQISEPDDQNIVSITATDGERSSVYTLKFKRTPDGIKYDNREEANIYNNGMQVYISGYNGIAEVYTADGRKITEKQVDGSADFNLNDPGIYIIRISGKSKVLIVK